MKEETEEHGNEANILTAAREWNWFTKSNICICLFIYNLFISITYFISFIY
jgi:hypothetical protein